MELIKKFIKSKERKYPKNTLINYESDIRLFFKKYDEGETELQLINKINPLMVEDFINEKKYSEKSLNRKLASLTLFYDFLINMNLIEKNPFKKIDRYSNPKSKQTDLLNIQEVKQLINTTYIKCDKDRCFDFASARTRFIIALMTSTGIRIEEVLTLKFDFIKKVEENFIITIPSSLTKNNKAKRVPICGLTKKYFYEYLDLRKKINVDSDILILSNNYKKLSAKDSRNSIKKYVERSGINKSIRNHSFRHTFRTTLTKKNVNESLICCIGSWSRKSLGNQSDIYLHDDEGLDNIKIKVCKQVWE